MKSAFVGTRTLGGLGFAFLAIAIFLIVREFSVGFGYSAAVILAATAVALPRLKQQARTIGALAFSAFGLSTPIVFLVAEREPHMLVGISAFCATSAFLVYATRAAWQSFDTAVPERKWANVENITLWAALTVSSLALAWATYFWFLSPLGDAFLARRLVFTVALVATGLVLAMRSHRTPLPFVGMSGLSVLGTGVAKALLYDTTHLTGVLRIAVFAACGLLLVIAAKVVSLKGAEA